MNCELLNADNEGRRIYNDFGKSSIYFIEKYFNDIIPTYNKFILNKKVRAGYNLLAKNEIKNHLGKNFTGTSELSKNMFLKAIGLKNNELAKKGIERTYKAFNVHKSEGRDFWIYGLRYTNKALNIDKKIENVQGRILPGNIIQKEIDELENIKQINNKQINNKQNEFKFQEDVERLEREDAKRAGREDNSHYLFESRVDDSDNNEVNYKLSIIRGLEKFINSPKGIIRQTLRLNTKEKPYIEINIRKALQGKGVTNKQIDLLFNYMKDNNLKEISVEDAIIGLLANYSYTVEINIAKDKIIEGGYISTLGSKVSSMENRYGKYYYTDERGVEIQINKTDWETAKQIFDDFQKGSNKGVPTQYYSNLTVNKDFYKNNPDWEYKEQRITTPLITPSIKGHAQFAESNDIGWFRAWYNKKTGEVHVLEVQSDLFQKWWKNFNFNNNNFTVERDLKTKEWIYKKDNSVITKKEYFNAWNTFLETSENNKDQYLKLLQKNDNWVTFFVKSIIQDTAKQTVTEVQESDVEAKVRELEKEGLLEIDCKSKLKAKDGIATLFEKGGKWEIVTDFKNAPTHKSGGKDISVQGKKVEVEKNELRIENDFGDVAVIPSKYRIEIQDAIKSNCHSCIDGIVETLPKMKDYAGDGTVFPFFGRYRRFKNSLPDNLKNTPEDDYAMRYYWKHSNKPKSFDEAINKEHPMFTMEDDGYYHAPSVEPNTLRFLKPKNHPTLQYELDWYNSDNPDAVDFRSKYDLNTSDKFYRYVPKKLGQ